MATRKVGRAGKAAASTARKAGRGQRAQAQRGAPRDGNGGGGGRKPLRHTHPPLGRNGARFATQLGFVAMRTVYAGVARDQDFVERMKANGKYTPEFQRFEAMEVPEEVRRWIAEHFRGEGIVHDAITSEVAVALQHAQAVPGDAKQDQFHAVPKRIEPEAEPKGPGAMTNPPPLSCCTPMCGPP
jgi:hypothetical protein